MGDIAGHVALRNTVGLHTCQTDGRIGAHPSPDVDKMKDPSCSRNHATHNVGWMLVLNKIMVAIPAIHTASITTDIVTTTTNSSTNVSAIIHTAIVTAIITNSFFTTTVCVKIQLVFVDFV